MASINKNFDYRLVVILPTVTRGLNSDDKSELASFGGFQYTPSKIVQPAEVQPSVPIEILDYKANNEALKIKLQEDKRLLNLYADTIDKRCAHLTVYYDPSNPDYESVTEACNAIFGTTDGKISYNMYRDALEFQHKLDNHIAQRSVESGGGI